jgi:predicted dehydrogenase
MNNIWLVGAGAVAIAHSKVMTALRVDYSVVGRGKESADFFTKETGIPVERGGLLKALKNAPSPEIVILALPITNLAEAAHLFIEAGTQRILIEKPGSLSIKVLSSIRDAAVAKDCLVFIAYNRRFYSSTQELIRIAKIDGGVTGVSFEFNEPKQIMDSRSFPDEVLQKWFVANSSHVVDLVFHTCGHPTEWQSWSAGSLGGHPSASRFAGAGKLDSGALFSYISDWESPGRWGIEIMTNSHRLILRPMEKLHTMRHGSFDIHEVKIDDALDISFKPGFFLQMEAFLGKKESELCSIDAHIRNMDFYFKMANYELES